MSRPKFVLLEDGGRSDPSANILMLQENGMYRAIGRAWDVESATELVAQADRGLRATDTLPE